MENFSAPRDNSRESFVTSSVLCHEEEDSSTSCVKKEVGSCVGQSSVYNRLEKPARNLEEATIPSVKKEEKTRKEPSRKRKTQLEPSAKRVLDEMAASGYCICHLNRPEVFGHRNKFIKIIEEERGIEVYEHSCQRCESLQAPAKAVCHKQKLENLLSSESKNFSKEKAETVLVQSEEELTPDVSITNVCHTRQEKSKEASPACNIGKTPIKQFVGSNSSWLLPRREMSEGSNATKPAQPNTRLHQCEGVFDQTSLSAAWHSTVLKWLPRATLKALESAVTYAESIFKVSVAKTLMSLSPEKKKKFVEELSKSFHASLEALLSSDSSQDLPSKPRPVPKSQNIVLEQTKEPKSSPADELKAQKAQEEINKLYNRCMAAPVERQWILADLVVNRNKMFNFRETRQIIADIFQVGYNNFCGLVADDARRCYTLLIDAKALNKALSSNAQRGAGSLIPWSIQDVPHRRRTIQAVGSSLTGNTKNRFRRRLGKALLEAVADSNCEVLVGFILADGMPESQSPSFST